MHSLILCIVGILLIVPRVHVLLIVNIKKYDALKLLCIKLMENNIAFIKHTITSTYFNEILFIRILDEMCIPWYSLQLNQGIRKERTSTNTHL